MKSQTYQKILDYFEAVKSSHMTHQLTEVRTLIGEIQRLDKDPTEQQVLSVLKKLIKGCDETLKQLDTVNNSMMVFSVMSERDFYNQFAPQKMTEEDLRSLIVTLKAGGASLGGAMKQLKADYEGTYDGATAARLYKET